MYLISTYYHRPNRTDDIAFVSAAAKELVMYAT